VPLSDAVLIDGHMLGARETGNETYVRGLLQGLEAIGQRVAVAVRSADVDVGAHTPMLLPRHSNAARLLVDLRAAAQRCRADVVHSTYAAPLRVHCARVVTVHDLSFLVHPEWFTRRDLAVLNAGVRFSVHHAERVIVPSHHARNELMSLLHVPARRVVVTPEAADTRFHAPDDAASTSLRHRHGLSRPFVLSLGNQQPRKNLARLLRAWRLLLRGELNAGCCLVIAGGHHGRRDDLGALIDELGLGKHVEILGYVTDGDVPGLYRAAEAFVFPSLYEGFGLPLLEAMACGTPVACSNVTSLPEVAGDAAVFFDPLDPAGIAAALATILNDHEMRAALQRRGLRRAALFDWQDCARTTLGAYEEAAHERRRRQLGQVRP
jgi:glycosyltransferase involved in cell wall biosynthesis